MTSCWQRDDNEIRDKLKCPWFSFKWRLSGHSRAALTSVNVTPNYLWQIWGGSSFFWLNISFGSGQVYIFDGVHNSSQQNLTFGSICAALLDSMEKTRNGEFDGGCGGGRRSGRLATRWMTGVSLTCRQAPRCLLVSHCHLCQQTMSCVQPSALIHTSTRIVHTWLTAGRHRSMRVTDRLPFLHRCGLNTVMCGKPADNVRSENFEGWRAEVRSRQRCKSSRVWTLAMTFYPQYSAALSGIFRQRDSFVNSLGTIIINF